MALLARAARPALSLAAALAAAAASCIVPCNDIGCDGGLEWTAAPADGSTIVPGAYHIDFVLEGTSHVVVCDIAAGLRDSECSQPVVTGGDAFDIVVDLTPRQVGDTWDPDAPVEALRVSIADHSDWHDDDRSQSVRGPEDVEITLTLDGRTLLDDAFAREYARDEDFWGDERCGYCDEREDRSSQWTP